MKMEILSIYTWPVHASYVCVCARAHSNIIVILIAVLVSLSVSLPSRHQFNRLLTACIVSLLDFKSLNVLLKYCVKWNSMILLIRSHFSFIDLVFKTPQAFIWVLRRTILWLLYFLLSILTIWSWVKMLNTYANWQSENCQGVQRRKSLELWHYILTIWQFIYCPCYTSHSFYQPIIYRLTHLFRLLHIDKYMFIK